MGHIHLGVLPRTRAWKEVVRLLADLEPPDSVIAAAGDAADRDLRRASADEGFVETLRLLANVPLAAKQSDFGRALRDLGIPAGQDPDLFDLVSAIGERLDRHALHSAARSDFGELARRALLSTLAAQLGDALPGLVDSSPADLQAAVGRLAQPRAFATLARGYFNELLSQTLRSWLDRTLSAQVGLGLRFAHVGERREFDAALSQYCSEATRIIREFSSGWYAKTVQREGRVDADHARVFGAVALKKILEEIRYKRGGDD